MKNKKLFSMLIAVLVFSQTTLTVSANTLTSVSDNSIEKNTQATTETKGKEIPDKENKSAEDDDVKITDDEILTDETQENEVQEDELENLEMEIKKSFREISQKKPMLALITNGDYYPLYSEAGNQGTLVGNLPSGTQVILQDVELMEDGNLSFLVLSGLNGTEVRGYVDLYYLVTEDTDFNEWKNAVLADKPGVRMYAEESNVDLIYKNFPSGYHEKLISLASAHPNWTFVAFNTGLEWYDVVMAESEGNRSLVYRTVVDSWKSKDPGDYDVATGQYIPKSGSNWFRASQTAVSFCLNPLNYLDEMHVFAFEQLTYNQNVHNRDGVNAVIRNSWMYDRALEDGSGGYYCDVFMQVGQQTGVSPYHLASRVLQEQGTQGSAQLISGYGGVYNYFNVQANGSTAEEILANGTAYAQSMGWNTRFLSICGGAERLGSNYITKGQDTLYLQKFDVDSSYYGLYQHQYMQNIQAPTTESVSVYKAYSTAGALNNNFVFKIPVYNNMPENGDYVIKDNPTSEAFIRQIYSTILGREPDAEGLQYWLGVQKKGMSAADIVSYFFNSKEMKNKNLSNEEFLLYAYKAIMGREPDEEGKNYWLGFLNQGATRNWVVSCFVTSGEFTALCSDFGIVRGTVSDLKDADKNAKVSMFVTRIYRNVLKRDPDEDGLNYWAGCVLNKGVSGADVVKYFVGSNEFMNANVSTEEFLERLYIAVLGRNSDADGLAYWTNYMNNGHSRQEVLSLFVVSKEFKEICASYGVKAGG